MKKGHVNLVGMLYNCDHVHISKKQRQKNKFKDTKTDKTLEIAAICFTLFKLFTFAFSLTKVMKRK